MAEAGNFHFSMRSLSVILVLLISPTVDGGLSVAPAAAWSIQQPPPRWQLAAAFVKRDSTALRRFLATDVMIWPPAPDTARRGGPAIAYFLDLALASRVSQSEFRPRSVTTDGAYLIEEGMWSFTHRRVKVSARYDLRWRQADGRWQVSFLKWDLFR
jgi:ketosteroid isomerase-like protein